MKIKIYLMKYPGDRRIDVFFVEREAMVRAASLGGEVEEVSIRPEYPHISAALLRGYPK
jgi:hypothetical protein